MQALSKAAAGKSYTIKWMFGIPEVLDKIRKCKIDEGSEITCLLYTSPSPRDCS